MNQDTLKRQVAKAALEYIQPETIIGVGTGSTVNFFIEQLGNIKGQIKGAVASSIETERRLKEYAIPTYDLNEVIDELSVYIDGADTFNALKQLVKGGGGALTREKILASASPKFICIVDNGKKDQILGKFPIAIEVIPMARSLVAKHIVQLQGRPVYRPNFVTDNGNIILDVFDWEIHEPIALESQLNDIPGVVSNGIFAQRSADQILIGHEDKVESL